jgi:glycosyltransferase involved in cell wall biosynthesis
VIPTFNNKALKRAYNNLRSILMQDYTNYRFIVVDDGSVDGTGNYIKDYLKSQNKVDSSRYEVKILSERKYAMNN